MSTVATGHAQTLPAIAAPRPVEHEAGQSPLCDSDLIDGTFTFGSLPAGEQTVSLHFQNKSNAACRLHGQAGPSFAVDTHSMNVASCWLCDQDNTPSPDPERLSGNQIPLAPGERATLDLHWASSGESCQWADWVDFLFLVGEGDLLSLQSIRVAHAHLLGGEERRLSGGGEFANHWRS